MQAELDRRAGFLAPALQQRVWSIARILHLQDALTIVRHALLPYLGTRVLVFAVALLANFYVLGTEKAHLGKPKLADETHFPAALWLNWEHFDSGFYLHLAITGYPAARPRPHFSIWEFYPLYPMLVHPFGIAFGGNWRAFSIAGLLVANVAALVALAYLFVLVRREFDQRVAVLTVVLLALFPSSFFLSAIYSESVFLAPAIACLYYARQQRWLLTGICGGLATLARGPGILLLLPVAWEFWQAISDRFAPTPPPFGTGRAERLQLWWASRLYGPMLAFRSFRTWLALLALLLIPAAQVGFMVYAKLRSGSFLANLDAIRTWNHRLTWPWTTVIHDLIRHPITTTSPWSYNLYTESVALVVIFAAFTIWAFVHLPTIYALYSLVMYLVPLSSGYITSLPRYYLVIFPAFILLARWLDPQRRPAGYSLLVGTFAAMLAMSTAFFELGFQISGA